MLMICYVIERYIFFKKCAPICGRNKASTWVDKCKNRDHLIHNYDGYNLVSQCCLVKNGFQQFQPPFYVSTHIICWDFFLLYIR